MKAATLAGGWGRPLVITKDAPEPKPGQREVLVRLKVTGICHTDVSFWKGTRPQIAERMVRNGVSILGHEGVGLVQSAGPGVSRLRVGDRVGVPYINSSCGVCDPCRAGGPNWCQRIKVTGLDINGTFAELVTVSESAAPLVPEEIPDDEAAPLLCAGVAAYGAVRKVMTALGVGPGKTVAMVGGAGGVGHFAVQIAKALGYKVVGIDVGRAKLDLMESIGADRVLDASVAEERMSPEGGANAAVVFTPSIHGYNLAVRIVKPMGGVVCVGTAAGTGGLMDITPSDIVRKGLSLVPGVGGTSEDFAALFSLYREGKVRTHISRRVCLEDINEILSELENSRYTGKAVVVI